MINFQYVRASSIADAVSLLADSPTAKFVAGGTNLIDLMKMDVEQPSKLIDISRLELDKVEDAAEGGLRIGALVLHGAYFDVATGEVLVREAEGYRSLLQAEPVRA